MEIQTYIETILKPQLNKFGVDHPEAQQIVCYDVHNRLSSLLCHWDDTEFRRTALIVGIEEANFYKPEDASLDIRALVTCCIRNSIIEDLHSTRAYTPKLRKLCISECIDGERITEVTEKAVEYWNENLSVGNSVGKPEKDLYESVSATYPTAWYVLSQLAATSEQNIEANFPPVKFPTLPIPPQLNSLLEENPSNSESGYSPVLNQQLIDYLRTFQMRQGGFFSTYSFKFITRNVNKLFRIIDFVLANGGKLVTYNYLITNGYVSRRVRLVKPPHTTKGNSLPPLKRDEVSQHHYKYLKQLGLQS